jgi:hypothetical protein
MTAVPPVIGVPLEEELVLLVLAQPAAAVASAAAPMTTANIFLRSLELHLR